MTTATNLSAPRSVIRELAATESFFLLGDGMYVGYGVRAEGPLDLDALRGAAARLVDAHPALRARIAADAPADSAPGGALAGGTFVAGDERNVIAVTESAGPTDGTAPLPDLDLAQGSALAGVHVVTDPDGGRLVHLLVHHALADGHHALALLQSLWRAYTAIVTGADDPLDARTDFPKPLEQFLTERGYPTAAEEPIEAPPLPPLPEGVPAAAPAPADAPALHRIQLSREESAALIAYGHRTGRTVNQLVSAAFVAATAAARGLGLTGVVYGYPVDLRRRLGDPAADFTEITNALGMAFFQADADEAGLDELAAQVGDGLARDLAAGTVQRPMSVGAAMAPPADGAVAILTNWGPVPHLPTPPGLTLTDFHPALHLAGGAPSDTAMWDAVAATLTIGIVSSFQGRLSIDVSGATLPDSLLPETLRNLRAFTLDE
ncbi:phthiocerol/phthiodiolone dimycocerosyl transferase family protein [Tsukamurella pulmonis]|uniref:phthiocerol/phthiodiolone dimycocerosyl transferase family protein n=1 Tax=Tsukamurella pulmonis TaxID=47312 RepID=UPI000AE18416|nr:hypothetical protein [Tsukamurella pulmonis]